MVFCVGLVALMGYFVSVQVTQAHRHTAATATLAHVRAVLTPHVVALGTVRGQNDELSAHLDAAFSDSLFTETGLKVSVVRRDGTVVYSTRKGGTASQRLMTGTLAAAFSTSLQGDVPPVKHGFTDATLNPQAYLEITVPLAEAAEAADAEAADAAPALVAQVHRKTQDIDQETMPVIWGVWITSGLLSVLVVVFFLWLIRRGTEPMAGLSHAPSPLGGSESDLKHAQATALSELLQRRIAADLHDGPLQTIAFSALKIEMLSEDLALDPSKVDRRALDVVVDALRQGMTELRQIASDALTPAVERMVVNDVVNECVARFSKTTGFEVDVRTHSAAKTGALVVSSAVKVTLFRTLQEALSNAGKHADGRGIGVTCALGVGGVQLVVSDSGPVMRGDERGADGAIYQQLDSVPDVHMGLRLMRERLLLLGGNLTLGPNPGGGCVLSAFIPLQADVL
jgi:signal transduction histidine kinase